MMAPLVNTVRDYAWGSETALPDLLGLAPTGRPQAELWLGAHPIAPSRVPGPDGTTRPLDEVIGEDPDRLLGRACVDVFGGQLPFLLKVLAVEEPLSIQAHPTRSQAERGYAAEDAAGMPRDAAVRNYRDPNPKPEIVHAITEFDALLGFRTVPATLALLDALGVAALERLVHHLRENPHRAGLADAVRTILSADTDAVIALVAAVGAACRSPRAAAYAREAATMADLADRYPRDPGVLVALLLDRVVLAPGQTFFVPAGVPHAYLHGTAVELQAASDNTLRGGLTPKHVDVPALLEILDTEPRVIPLTDATPGDPGEQVFVPPVAEFRLSRIDVGEPGRTVLGGLGPQILLCLDGAVQVRSGASGLPLTRGGSVFVGADEGDVVLHGHGTVFRATTNLDPDR